MGGLQSVQVGKSSVRLDSLFLRLPSSIILPQYLYFWYSHLHMILQVSDSSDLCYELVVVPSCHKQLHLLCIQVHGSIGLMDSSLAQP